MSLQEIQAPILTHAHSRGLALYNSMFRTDPLFETSPVGKHGLLGAGREGAAPLRDGRNGLDPSIIPMSLF